MISLDEIILNGKETALAVIDIVNDFCCDGFRYNELGWDFKSMKEMVDRRLLKFVRRSKGNTMLVFIKSFYDPNQFANDKNAVTNLCVEGTKGAEFYGLNPRDADFVFIKHVWSALIGKDSKPTQLHYWFQERGINTLVELGVTLTHCISHNIEDALKLGYRVVLPRDCVASRGELFDAHRKIISKYESSPNVMVVDSGQIKYT